MTKKEEIEDEQEESVNDNEDSKNVIIAPISIEGVLPFDRAIIGEFLHMMRKDVI